MRLPYVKGLLILFMKIHLGIELNVYMDGVDNGWDKLSVWGETQRCRHDLMALVLSSSIFCT